jgi:hypothetical protein
MRRPRSQLRTGGGTNVTITSLMGCQTVPNRDLEFEHRYASHHIDIASPNRLAGQNRVTRQ